MAIRDQVDIDTFLELDIRAGRIRRGEPFPEARNPSMKLWIDFGDEIGTKTSSAQLTRRYMPDELVGTTVLGVVNLPPRRIAGFVSEVLVLGVVDPDDPGDVVLVRPDGGGDVRGWRLA
ncbi:MAG: tRNA-binding protein [Longimicrobiales bacterium]